VRACQKLSSNEPSLVDCEPWLSSARYAWLVSWLEPAWLVRSFNHISTNQAKKKESSPQMDEMLNHVKYLNKLVNLTSNNKLERYFPTLVECWDSIVRSLNSLAHKFKYTYTFPDNIYLSSFTTVRNHIKYLSGLIQHQYDCLSKSFQDKQIKRFIQKRCDDYYDDKKHMIDSFLEHNKRTIVINHVLQTRDNCQTLVTDPDEIKKLTNEHFQTCASGVHHDVEIPDYWKPQYSPRLDINDNIYSFLMTDITNQEWDDATQQLPLNKATGPSGISYEMIKHLGPNMTKALITFLNACIRFNDIPSAWREANVYPIPKSKEWKCNLNNTRSIPLLEVLRKLMEFLTLVSPNFLFIIRFLKETNSLVYLVHLHLNLFILLTK
jgi:hypothetical protein